MQKIPWIYAVRPDQAAQRWPLMPGRIVVGRRTPTDELGKLGVQGDASLSRLQLTVELEGDHLLVHRYPGAKNGLYFQGEESEAICLSAGQHFVAGETQFQFVLLAESEPDAPAHEFTLAHGNREGLRAAQAAQCLHALTMLMPSFRRCSELSDMWQVSGEILRSLLPQADEIMVMRLDRAGLDQPGHSFYELLCYHGRSLEGGSPLEGGGGGCNHGSTCEPVPPSRRLLASAFRQGETVLHLWDSASPTNQEMTWSAGQNWGLAAPIEVSAGEDFALYAAGSGEPGQLERVLVDLVGETLSHQLVARRMQSIRAQVGQFFSPALRRLVGQENFSEILRPARRNVTVMFFDLRGFSRATEAMDSGLGESGPASDEALERIMRHHEKMMEVMSQVTGCVFAEGGIVIDYQGDAVLGCFGAPTPSADHAERAVRAARATLEKVYAIELPFLEDHDPTKGGPPMRCGIGLGSGEVVAGQIGAMEQVKYGVMGTVVNQASRLEGLTKYFSVPILMTAEVRAQLPADQTCRRIGRVRPAGLAHSVEVHELVVEARYSGSGLSAEQVSSYESAEELFVRADMATALDRFQELPERDPVAKFLADRARGYLAEGVPPDWAGVIEFNVK